MVNYQKHLHSTAHNKSNKANSDDRSFIGQNYRMNWMNIGIGQCSPLNWHQGIDTSGELLQKNWIYLHLKGHKYRSVARQKMMILPSPFDSRFIQPGVHRLLWDIDNKTTCNIHCGLLSLALAPQRHTDTHLPTFLQPNHCHGNHVMESFLSQLMSTPSVAKI